MMRKEEQREEEAYLRRKARRDGENYKPPQVRRAEKKQSHIRAKQRRFAEELREYINKPQEYIESHRNVDPHTEVVSLAEEEDAEARRCGVWVPYLGPQGGEGWEHTGTGERRYQLEKPGTNLKMDEPPDIERLWRNL
jgi:hypothetical protein